MKKHLHYFRFLFSLMVTFVLLTGFLQQKVSALIIVSTDDITSSSVRIFWGPVAGATEYRVIVFGYDSGWRNYPGYPVIVKSPDTQLIANNIGYFDPFWSVYRKIWVEAYANGSLLDKGEKDIVLPEPGPVITGITNATYNSFTVSWSKTIGGNMEPWQKVTLSVENEETGEVAASFKDLTTTSQVVTGLAGGTRYVIRLRGYKRIYFSYYDEWREFWSDVTVGHVYTKLETPVALPGISMRPNAFMAQWNKTSGAKIYKLYVREKATGRMIIDGDSTTVLSWWVEGLESGQEYEYQVSAKNAIQESPKSNIIKVTTEALETPVAKQPTNVTDHSFKAWWNPVAGATKYRLEILIDNTWAWRFTTETSYEVTDLPLKPNTEYKYRVRAIFNTRLSYYGNEITVKTRPRAPVALQATNITNTSFTARWQSVTGATGYKLWVISTASTGLSPQGYFPKTLGNVDNHTVTGLVSGIEYLYYIQTLVSGGESLVSGTIYVTTTGATTYSVNLSVTPAGGGIVSGGGTFAPGKSVTATATVNPGYEFVNWTEGTKVLTTNTSYTFTVSANRNLVANFRSLPAQCVVSLTANPGDGGTVSGDGTYSEGTSVSVKASTASGFEFVNWTKGSTVVSTSSGYIFTVKESTTLVANFKAVMPQYTLSLTASPTAGGSVSGGGTYISGTELVVKATPAKGYEFVNWTEGTKVVSTNTGYTLTLSGNRSLTANFRAVAATYSLSLTSDPFFGGTTDGGGNYAPGTQVTIRAIPDRGFEFVNWTEGTTLVSKSPSYTFTLNSNRTLAANFREKAVSYTVGLSATPAAGGTVSGGGTFTQGSSVTVTATPADGYEFVNWTEGTTAVSTSASYTFTLNGDRSLTANFREKAVNYTVGLSATPAAGGTVTGGGTFTQGSSVTVTATPASGYEFVNWTEGSAKVSTSASYTFTLNGDRSLTANFREKAVTNTVALSASPAAGGTVSGGGTFTQGSSVTVSATSASGYEFVNWTEGTTAVSTSASYTFTLSANRSLTANFRQQTVTYTLGVAAVPVAGGTVSGGGTFTQGSSVTVTATPAKGYLFVNWSEGTAAVSTSSSYTFTLNGNRTLTANFTVNTPVNDLIRSEFKVWPNPVTSELHIQGVKGKGLLKLSNISGRLVYQNSGTFPEWIVPMERFQPGIYLLIIETVEGRQVRKIVRK